MSERAPDFNPESGGAQEIQSKIVESLKSEEFRKTMNTESIGGNAGPNKAAVNSMINRETGEILDIGNEAFKQTFDESLNATPAVFVCDFTEMFEQIRQDPENLKKSKVTISVLPSSLEKLSEQARTNLEEAVKIFNER